MVIFRDNGENGGEGVVGGVSLDDNRVVWDPVREDWSRGKRLLEHLEGCGCLAGEAGERNNNVGVVENEATIKIGEAKEGLHVLHFSRLGPILNYLHLCLVHGEPLRGQNVPKVLHPFRMKLTFVGAGEEPVLAKAAEHFSDMFAMIRRIVGVDEDVV